MNPTDLYPQVINNIARLYKSFNNDEKLKEKVSHLLLFVEYEARFYEWKNAFGVKGSFFGYPRRSQDLFRDLSPAWKNELFTETYVIDDLIRLGFKHVSSAHRNHTGYYWSLYINWEIFKDYPEIKQYAHLPHPYEPVFKIMIAGGDIFYSEQDYYVTGGRFQYNKNIRLPSVDDAFINYIDERCVTLPTQAIINNLWYDFERMQGRVITPSPLPTHPSTH